MSEVAMKTTIYASADEVWKTVSDFNGLPKFVAAIVKSTMEGSGVGAIRTLSLKDGGPPVIEKLEHMDPQARILKYSIVESPLPLEKYLATVEVRELDPKRCEVKWSSTFEPKGVPEAAAQKIVQGVYTAGFEGLKKLYGGE
ncbi:MAG: SRPBCC family protein [Desulfobacterales bacterium]|nr:MAG: SRPBCC family protein [Desulfobacterales bacterium]